ncbi:MAG TPA: HlyD family efflux transporter periplasmic adaptor subunit [Pirellulales bacterium]|jgi:macrolide-specific efflux system membrane fusion protein|nr:HlyD family efflux transporter periplasmic adaptor subunit [Pirellulales bacterium]
MRIIVLTVSACLALAALAWAQRPAASTTASNAPPASSGATSQPGTVTLDHSEVRLDEEAQVPAQEAGVLMKIEVHEGDQVPLNTLLAQIDDAQVQKQLKNATAEYNGAAEKSNSDIDVRYATAAYEVAKFEYLRCLEANKKQPLAFSDVEMAEKKFAADKANLAIEQAGKQHIVDGYTSEAKEAEVDLAKEAIKRRKITSPIEGVVQQVYAHLGEWVKPGDAVVRVIRMDRLRVEGYLDKDKFSPGEIADHPVVVQAELTNGRKVQFPGKIVFVDPEVRGETEYTVRATVDNRKENGQWLLRPGMPAAMTIQLK